MNAVVALAAVAGALGLVVLVNRQREAQTQAMIAAAKSNVYDGGPIGFTDVFNGVGTVAAFYYGGISGGSAFVKGIK